jgi:hypothetical protein
MTDPRAHAARGATGIVGVVLLASGIAATVHGNYAYTWVIAAGSLVLSAAWATPGRTNSGVALVRGLLGVAAAAIGIAGLAGGLEVVPGFSGAAWLAIAAMSMGSAGSGIANRRRRLPTL